MGMGGRVMRKPGGRGWHGVRAADDSEILRLKDISLELLKYLQWTLLKVCDVIYNNHSTHPPPTIWEDEQVSAIGF